MRAIVSINMSIPTVENHLEYLSGASLRDYDIAIFNPKFPLLSRISFNAGGSCLSIESTNLITKAILHWKNELNSALQAGKTIFVVMSDYEEDSAATGSTMKTRNERNYSTININNYQSLPFSIDLTNSKGKKIITVESIYKNLYEAVKDVISYKVIINSKITKKAFATKDGAVVGGVVRMSDYTGSVVLLPHFDFDDIQFYAQDGDDEAVWSESALKASGALTGQIVAIDKAIKGSPDYSPPPNWVKNIQTPIVISTINQNITNLDDQISTLQHQRE